MRQGNLNGEVEILRYVTERPFDGYLFQAVERKARFIAQVMRGPDTRSGQMTKISLTQALISLLSDAGHSPGHKSAL